MSHSIKLGETEYDLSTWNLNVLERLMDLWNCDLGKVFPELQKRLAKEGPKAMKQIVSAMLIDKYPEMTEHMVGSLITLSNASVFTEAITNSITDATGD